MTDELITQFSSASFSEWCREKFDRFTADPHAVPDAGEFVQAEFVGYVQSLPDGDTNRPLLVMAMHAGDQINERSSRRRQFDFARKQLQSAIDRPPTKVKGLFTQGLFAFYDNNGAFRLSLVSGRAEGKKLVYSDFKRQSFFVRPDRNNKTFRTRTASPFSTYQDLANAFSVEALTKEFYNSLFAWYERAMDPKSKVTFPNDLARDDDDRNLLPEHLIRLITRLMFVWFLRQKDLVPESLFDPKQLKPLLKEFEPESRTQDNYYRAILQNLFFATLNCEIKERSFAVERGGDNNKEHYGIKVLYRYGDEFTCPPGAVLKLFRQVPFLNGGLFECLDKKRDDAPRSPVLYHDGFSREPAKRAHIPNNLFLDDEGLITLFSRYDFTVDENSPNDADVALDPELLGKVFENLLGAYNPETQQTARKQSGSFYTPREIVNYMVDESLIAHLRTQVPEGEESALRLLLGEDKPPDFSETLRRKLVASLYHCRILDPACGSGAFPMGLLLKMVHLLQRLDPHNTLWHETVMAETEKALAEAETLSAAEKRLRRQRITDSFDQSVNQPDYARKLYLIENCIFGVDIQPIAVQIAKLRAFITLVCNQEPDLANVDGNYGMLPLPNLETKFVAANSLIGLTADFANGLQSAEGDSRLDDSALVRLRAELAEIRHQHFRARTVPDKNACRKQDRELRGRIKARLVEIASKPDAAKLARFQAEIELLQKQRKEFEVENWQDVVQSQPSLGGILDATGPVQTSLRIDLNADKRNRLDDDLRRLSRAIEAEQNRAKNKSTFQKEADRLAVWDPYDQNTTSPFFDAQWMFDVKRGFDIVIGNPPYFGVGTMPKDIIEYLKGRYSDIHTGYNDIVYYFIYLSLHQVTCRGTVVLITSNYYLGNEYAKKLRMALAPNVIKVINFKDHQVFSAASVHTCITLLHKSPPIDIVEFYESIADKRDTSTVLDGSMKCVSMPRSQLKETWIVADNRRQTLIDKITSGSRTLGSLSEIAKGPETGNNSVFTLSGADICKHGIEKELIRRCIKNSHIDKYVVTWQGDLLLYTDSFFSAKQYPKAFAYLKKNQSELMKRRGPKYNEYAWWRLHRPSIKAVFDASEKIVVPYRAPSNRFAYDDQQYFNDGGDIRAIVIKDKQFSCKYVLALLNSKLIDWFYGFIGKPKGDAREYFNKPLALIPIKPPPTSDLQIEIETHVEAILAQKKVNPAADVSAIEANIDGFVYALYNLTAEEIAIVEGRDSNAKKTPAGANTAKTAVTHKKPRKSVMTVDPDLS